MSKSSPLIIASMHRSGSSLVASLLQSAGLQIGERLMEAARDNNIKGFFENLDFVEFHMELLRSHELERNGWTLQKKIKVSDIFIDRAKQIVDRNSTDEYWGWKDPRTTLFLKFWAELLPGAKYLLVFRSPWEVVDSLYRRGDLHFQTQPELAVKMWAHYNKKILKFVNCFPHRCLLANIRTIVDNQKSWIEAINQKFHVCLDVPNSQIYEPSLLQSQTTNSCRSALIEQHFPKAIVLYKRLNTLAWYPNRQAFAERQSELSDRVSSDRSMFFADWRNLRVLEVRNRDLEVQLQQTDAMLKQSQAQICETQTALERSQEQVRETETVLEQSQSQLHEAEAALEQYQYELHEIEAVLEQSQTQLHETETVLDRSQIQLHQAYIELEQTKTQLQQTKVNLEYKEEQLERLRLQYLIGSDSTREKHIQYELLVWDAWYAYQSNELTKMQELLKRSLRCTPFSLTETLLKWLESFTNFSTEKGHRFDSYSLTSSEEWKQLTRRATIVKNSSNLLEKGEVVTIR
ncbi:sulfotransferase [Pseudanabaena sp. PCC 6802]|uniref:sulfotransferase n=1 Tax=Pseudanabaena sp. PCC 6802 TaxID=118173 RepID=UPI0003455DF0|nr:sulfotransferase [Pseudanabaena sp. PCC 6802]